MSFFKAFIILFALVMLSIAPSSAMEADIHKVTCDKLGGVLQSEYLCPKSGVLREGDFCVLKDQPQQPFFNGCTAGVAGYDQVFYNSCLKHDFCYHHEPSTYQFTKEQCDEQFYQDMAEICDQRDSKRKRCFTMAYFFYQSVAYFGNKSWNCSNSYFDYKSLFL